MSPMVRRAATLAFITAAIIAVGWFMISGGGKPPGELLVVMLTALFFSGAPLYAVLLAATALCAIYLPDHPRAFAAEFGGNLVSAFDAGAKEEAKVFATIPLFIYAGYIMAAAKTSDRLVRFANALLGWLPGGLAIVTIFACAIFTIFTGASGVTIVALGALVMPALLKQQYPKGFSLGLITGTGSVGLLFPPALPLFVYGLVYQLQATQLEKIECLPDEVTCDKFAPDVAWQPINEAVDGWATERFIFAGLLPGLVLIGCLSVLAVGTAIYLKIPRQKFSLPELGKSFVAVLPELLLPAVVLVPLLTNVASTIAQCAALTVVYLAFLEIVVYRDIKLKTLWSIGHEALALIGTIFLIVYVSSAFTNALTIAQVPDDLVAWARSNVDNGLVFLLVLNLLLLVVGMMMDIFSATLIVVPLIAPVAYYYGIDPYHLGVIFILNLEIGYLTPPVGLNLFISSFKFQKPVPEVVKASLPFMGAMVFALILVTYIPAITAASVPPPKRDRTAASLRTIVHDGYKLVQTGQMTLPDGSVVERSACGALEGDAKGNCDRIFAAYADCLDKEDPAARTACQTTAAADYAAEFKKVESVALPDGRTLGVSDCAAEAGPVKELCDTIFADLPECLRIRATSGATLARDCELNAIAEYVAVKTGVDEVEVKGGKTIKKGACGGDLEAEECDELFTDLLECVANQVREADPEAGKTARRECEVEKLTDAGLLEEADDEEEDEE